MDPNDLMKAKASYTRQLNQLIKECAHGEHRVRQMAGVTADCIKVIEFIDSQLKAAPKPKIDKKED